MDIDETHVVTDLAGLREIIAEANPRAAVKVIDHVDSYCARIIAASPFLVMGTYGTDGLVDLSPKGDPAGFVKVLNSKTLLVPDRIGNGRLDSFENLLSNPAVSLIFLIPGHNDTLRVAGKGRLTTQPDLLEILAVNGRAPNLALLVEVQEAYMHCPKCMVRSKMWHPEHWPDTSDVPTMGEAMVAHGKLVERGLVADAEELDAIIEGQRHNALY